MYACRLIGFLCRIERRNKLDACCDLLSGCETHAQRRFHDSQHLGIGEAAKIAGGWILVQNHVEDGNTLRVLLPLIG